MSKPDWDARRDEAGPDAWHDWLDEDAGELTVPEDAGDRRRLADLLFVDGLLAEAHENDPAKRERRLARVMAALDQEAHTSADFRAAERNAHADGREVTPDMSAAVATAAGHRTRRLPRRWMVSAALAAMLLVAFTVLFQGGGTSPAHAAIEQAYRHAAQAQDRIYLITTELQRPTSTKLSVATLYARGASQFVIHQPSLFGTEFWLGGDGVTNWMVPPIGPVLTGPESKWLRKRLDERDLDLPFMQITTVLGHLLEDHYRVDLRPNEELPGRGSTRWQYIHATRPAGRPFLPHSVDLWVHPETGAVERMILDWKLPLTQIGVRQMRFDRLPDEELPSDWYTAGGHHGEDREVIDLGILAP